jgi:hypothetical protein
MGRLEHKAGRRRQERLIGACGRCAGPERREPIQVRTLPPRCRSRVRLVRDPEADGGAPLGCRPDPEAQRGGRTAPQLQPGKDATPSGQLLYGGPKKGPQILPRNRPGLGTGTEEAALVPAESANAAVRHEPGVGDEEWALVPSTGQEAAIRLPSEDGLVLRTAPCPTASATATLRRHRLPFSRRPPPPSIHSFSPADRARFRGDESGL